MCAAKRRKRTEQTTDLPQQKGRLDHTPVDNYNDIKENETERDRDQMRARMRAAWSLKLNDAELARQRLELLAAQLDRTWPDAAGSLREGLHDTLTLMRLGITGQLAKTLCSTNPCESMIEIVRYTQRNVKRWQDGDMRKRWTAAGMLAAEQQFRRIIGYRDLAKLVIAIERHANLAAPTNHNRQENAEPVTV